MRKFMLVGFLLCLMTGIVYAWCRTDYTCVSDCMDKGYLYKMCKSQCSWCEEE